MSVHAKVTDALAGKTDWRAEAALALAVSIDAGTGGASAVKELRALMTELDAEIPVGESQLDKLRARRGAA